MTDQIKFLLDENDIPNPGTTSPRPARSPGPFLHPGTGQPIGPDDLAPLFTMAAIMQEVSTERTIDIPSRCAIFIDNGDPVHCTVHDAWNKRWIRLPASTISRGGEPTGSHNPTPPSLKPSTAAKRGLSALPLKPAPANGVHPLPSPAQCLGWK
ncbi:MAG: hypothetical protein CM1200mP41_17230 [Gammaproteobacteria bacterium]|nr:MAG: hypothetical protein CM1200mP41_17230 [Gammaproteobacteria bacterium]